MLAVAEAMTAGTLRSHPRPASNGPGPAVIAHALTSEGADASEDGTGRGTPLVAVGFAENQRGEVIESEVRQEAAVRRLTPMECERLQGFPDRWTLLNVDGATQSDSARYRELGNAVAVPCVEWITRRLVAADALIGAASPSSAGEAA